MHSPGKIPDALSDFTHGLHNRFAGFIKGVQLAFRFVEQAGEIHDCRFVGREGLPELSGIFGDGFSRGKAFQHSGHTVQVIQQHHDVLHLFPLRVLFFFQGSSD